MGLIFCGAGRRTAPGSKEGKSDLQFLLQINHIYQLNTAFVNGMIVMIYKEIFDAMCTNKSTLFIEGNGAWAVAGANLQDRIPPLIFHGKKVNQGFSISFSVKRWNDSNILDLDRKSTRLNSSH